MSDYPILPHRRLERSLELNDPRDMLATCYQGKEYDCELRHVPQISGTVTLHNPRWMATDKRNSQMNARWMDIEILNEERSGVVATLTD